MRGIAIAMAMTTLATSAFAQVPATLEGRSLAATCSNCHGTSGVSEGDIPSLAGLAKDDIVRKMKDFRSGARPSSVMQQLAKGYTDEQIETVAAWFAAQKRSN